MTLTPGTQVGPYLIVEAIGAGGMGEVYRARDPRLEREVALKLLPPALARDPERWRRFEIEARAAGQLNHPNILAIFDFGVHEAAPYLAAEMLDGETLRQRLTPPVALPARKAAEITAQCARGLAAAHARGIVHRGLKPENIFLTRDGQVKILDFGLAKITGVEAAADAATLTAAANLTSAGQVLGTAGYMAPEQVRGEAADARSDLFSLGAVLYEMLSGRRAFQKPTAVETMSAILKEEPPALAASGAALEPELQRLVDHTLEKDPAARFQSARDLEFALAALAHAASASSIRAPLAIRAGRRRTFWLPMAAVAVVLAAALAYFLRPAPAAPAPSLRFTLPPPENAAYGNALALSPDGSQLVFVAVDGSSAQSQLWLRPLDAFAAHPLPATADAELPFWSPDGRQVGFFADGELKRVELATGLVTAIARAPINQDRGGAWSPDNTIVFAQRIRGPLMKVSADGGTPVPATALDPGHHEVSHRWPMFLPDGRHFLYLVLTGDSQGHYAEASLDSTQARYVEGVSQLSQAIVSDGFLIYPIDAGLVAQPFDWRGARITGPPRPLGINIVATGPIGPTGYIPVSAGAHQRLVWRSTSSRLSRLEIVDRAGKLVRTVAGPGLYTLPVLSPDGDTLAVSESNPATGANTIWLLNMTTGASHRLTVDASDHIWPIRSRDGRWVYFSSNADGRYDIYRERADGAGGAERVVRAADTAQPAMFTPDGRTLLYTSLSTQGSSDEFLLPVDPPGSVRRIDQSQSSNLGVGPRIDPSGRWLALYGDDSSGQLQIFVEPFPNSGGTRWQVSSSSGYWPAWSPDGHQLYFVSAGMLMAARVGADANGAFTFQPATPLFPIHSPESVLDTGASFTPLPGDKLFLINVLSGEASGADSPPISVLTQWPAVRGH